MNYENKPVACTISLSDANEQSVVWDTLLPSAISTERLEHGVALTFDRSVASQVDALVSIERQCCSFLDFNVERSDDEIRLTVSAEDAGGLQVIHEALGMTAA